VNFAPVGGSAVRQVLYRMRPHAGDRLKRPPRGIGEEYSTASRRGIAFLGKGLLVLRRSEFGDVENEIGKLIPRHKVRQRKRSP